jgi:hypothetical protein
VLRELAKATCASPHEELQVGPRQFDLRYWDPKGDFDVEATLECTVVAGPPHAWTLWPGEGEGGGVAASEADWVVQAGQTFSVIMELADAHGNKCALQPCWLRMQTATPSLATSSDAVVHPALA